MEFVLILQLAVTDANVFEPAQCQWDISHKTPTFGNALTSTSRTVVW